MSVNKGVFKLDKSNGFKELHPRNICSIQIINEVTIFDKSIDSKYSHPENIEDRLETNENKKFGIFIDFNEVHS